MYIVHVKAVRHVSVEQGQVEVEAMIEKGRENPTVGRSLLPGEELKHYPDWLITFMTKRGFSYDHFNWEFSKLVKTEGEALKWPLWIIEVSLFFKEKGFFNRIRMIFLTRKFFLLRYINKYGPEAEIVSMLEASILEDFNPAEAHDLCTTQ